MFGTAVDAKAMLPDVVVVNAPVGIKIIAPPPEDTDEGAVMVLIAVVPLINVMYAVGAIVPALAIVGAAVEDEDASE